MERDHEGKFIVGNTKGRRFPKGHTGRPLGTQNKKTKMIQEIATDVLKIDPYSGEEMSYKEYVIMLKWWALTNARIGEWFLNHGYGKPVEQVHQEQRLIILPPLPEQDAAAVTEEHEALPEGEE